jgi:hypothetical protein
MDNLANFGIKNDETAGSRRLKPRGKQRKPWVIECRIQRHVSNGLARTLGLQDWWVHGRYSTKNRRDQAYAAVVKKEDTAPRYWRREWRKVDP